MNPATDIKIVNENGEVKQPEKQEPMESQYAVDSDIVPELQQRMIGQVLGLEKDIEFDKYSDKLSLLVSYAKSQTTDHSPESLKWAIRSLEMKLGSPPIAEKRIAYVARYAYLEMEERKIKKEKEKFIRNDA